MGSALPGRCLLDDSERRCESGERERGMTGLGRLRDGTKGVLSAVYVRRDYVMHSPRPPIYLVHLQSSSTMTDAPATEEKKPQTKPLDDDNDVDDSDEEVAPEIAAANG